jgi:hypothetical protein
LDDVAIVMHPDELGTPAWSVPTAANGTPFIAAQKNLWAVATPD